MATNQTTAVRVACDNDYQFMHDRLDIDVTVGTANDDIKMCIETAGGIICSCEWFQRQFWFSVFIIVVEYPVDTVRCHYDEVNFLTNIHKQHPIARPSGCGTGCLLCIQHLVVSLPRFLQLFMQYLTILDRVITALDCTRWS